MGIWEIALLGVALSMDAVAVGMTNGMLEPRMRFPKMFLMAGIYAFFQFLMPVVGYYCGYAFSGFVKTIAPWLSFALLALIGGKMIFDFVRENLSRKRNIVSVRKAERPASEIGKLLIQAVATSIDALAVGVTLLAAETREGLPFPVVFCALIIGAVTFCLSSAAIFIGKKAGDRLADKAELFGGIVLCGIGIKILIEGLI